MSVETAIPPTNGFGGDNHNEIQSAQKKIIIEKASVPDTIKPEPDVKPSSKLANKIREVSNVGFAKIPNQIFRKAVLRGFNLNVLITGRPGLGKSTFINTLFSSDIYDSKIKSASQRLAKTTPTDSSAAADSMTTRVDTHVFSITEANVGLKLRVIDTPCYGQALDSSEAWQPIVDYIEARFEDYMLSEISVHRQTVGSGSSCYPIQIDNDQRVHLAFYLVAPNPHGLHQLDLVTLKRLSGMVNLVVIIAKADSLTPEECLECKKKINRQLKEHKIKVYDFPDLPETGEGRVDTKSLDKIRTYRQRQPFSIVSSDRLVERADGKKNLINITHTAHYASFYSSYLAKISEKITNQLPSSSSAKGANGQPTSMPLAQLEQMWKAVDAEKSELEAGFNQVLFDKVKERSQRLTQCQTSFNNTEAKWKATLVDEQAALQRKRAAFEAERAGWEKANEGLLNGSGNGDCDTRSMTLGANDNGSASGIYPERSKSNKRKGLFR